jgi:signal peptidase I
MSGTSMSPAIEDGDIITVEPISEEPVKPGDIVLYHSRFDTAVIHRVIRVERCASERCIVTRGDAASHTDGPVPMHRVLGRVSRVERAGERITMVVPRRSFLQTMRAWLHRLRFW